MVLFGSVPVDKTALKINHFRIKFSFQEVKKGNNTKGANKISPNLRRLKKHEEESEES